CTLPGAACLPQGGSCTQDVDCCRESCIGGVCGLSGHVDGGDAGDGGACIATGAVCTAQDTCCNAGANCTASGGSSICTLPGAACLPQGGSCTQDIDCCQESCIGGICEVPGHADGGVTASKGGSSGSCSSSAVGSAGTNGLGLAGIAGLVVGVGARRKRRSRGAPTLVSATKSCRTRGGP